MRVEQSREGENIVLSLQNNSEQFSSNLNTFNDTIKNIILQSNEFMSDKMDDTMTTNELLNYDPDTVSQYSLQTRQTKDTRMISFDWYQKNINEY